MQIVSQENNICMKFQILLHGKNKENTLSLSSAEFAQSIVNVNMLLVDY